MCIVWIGLLCHFMVHWAHEVAIIFGLDPIVVALVVLATGTSIPDAIGSMVAAKSGEANMAISNAVGSNVFDILLGLGLPWVLAGLTIHKDGMTVERDGKRARTTSPSKSAPAAPLDFAQTASLTSSFVRLPCVAGIIEYVGILFGTVFFFLLILVVSGWKMNSTVGGAMFVLYLGFIGYCMSKAA